MKKPEELIGPLTRYLEKHRLSQSAFARDEGLQQGSLSRFLKGEAGLNFESALKIMNRIGYSISSKLDTELAREVCFVNAKITPSGSEQSPPAAEDYIAVPMVNEVGAGPGIIPQDEILSWFLVYKHQEAVLYRSNLVAVQISKGSTSMQPVLKPGDVVLVDLDDKKTSKPGRIMLVMDPMDGSGMIKRVAVEEKNNDFRITFYSDNAAENPPLVYSWREDYNKNWDAVVGGHVVWAWSDVSNK